MYTPLQTAGTWTGDSLNEICNGQPLIHDDLRALGLLEPKDDRPGVVEMFEDDSSKLQACQLSRGAGFTARWDSFSLESEHS
jgi:hypothetical protein